MTKWIKVTEEVPPEGKSYLVWTGRNMIVSEVHIYSPETRTQYANWVDYPPPFMQFLKDNEKQRKHYLECQGYFEEFGQKYYLDDPDVFWSELPKPPGSEDESST